MSYGTIIEGEFFDDANVLKLLMAEKGSRAILCLLELRVWSTNAKTDGVVPLHALRKATTHPEPLNALSLLVDNGLAVQLSEDEWQIDWTAQTTAEERADQREGWRIKKRHQRGKHDECPESWWCRKKRKDSMSPGDVPSKKSPESRGESPGKPNLTQPDVVIGKGHGSEQEVAPTVAHSGAGAPLAPSVAQPREKRTDETEDEKYLRMYGLTKAQALGDDNEDEQ